VACGPDRKAEVKLGHWVRGPGDLDRLVPDLIGGTLHNGCGHDIERGCVGYDRKFYLPLPILTTTILTATPTI
jgi:hypothetical protein